MWRSKAVDESTECFSPHPVFGPPPNQRERRSRNTFRGPAAVLLGSVMMAVSPFLPWLSSSDVSLSLMPSSLMETASLSGREKIGDTVLLMTVLGVVSVILLLAYMVVRPESLTFRPVLRQALSLGPLLVGLIGLGFSLYYHQTVLSDVSGLPPPSTLYGFGQTFFEPSRGIGIYVCLSGSAITALGASEPLLKHLWMRFAGRSKPAIEDQESC